MHLEEQLLRNSSGDKRLVQSLCDPTPPRLTMMVCHLQDKLKEQERDSIRHRTRDGDSGRHRSSRDDGEGTRGSSEAPDERRRDSKRSASREAPLDDVPKRKVPRTGSSKRDVDGDAAMRVSPQDLEASLVEFS